MDKKTLSKIYISTFRIIYEFKESISMEPCIAIYSFRGSFGNNLGNISCENFREKNCNLCREGTTCPFFQVFNSSCRIKPYTINSDIYNGMLKFNKNSTISFDFTLYGDKIRFLPHCIIAFDRINYINQTPVKLREVMAINHITGEKEIIYENRSAVNKSFPFSLSDAEEISRKFKDDKLIINFSTPLNLVQNGTMITPECFTFPVFYKRLCEKINNIAWDHCDKIPLNKEFFQFDREVSLTEKMLYNTSWKPRITRDKHTQFIGGLSGEITLNGDLTGILPFIIFAGYIAIGKDTTLGLGKIKINKKM